MKVLNTAIPAGLNMPTGKVGRKWTKVYIDNLSEFIELMRVDTMRMNGDLYSVRNSVVALARYSEQKVELLSNGVVVAKGKLPC